MPGRNANPGNYRYGFNGMENDNEVKGVGNTIDYGARIYDSRLGRWMSPDPKSGLQPGWSTYKFGLDNPIIYIDPSGETEIIFNYVYDFRTRTTTLKISVSPRSMTDGIKYKTWHGSSGSYSLANRYFDFQTVRRTYVHSSGTYKDMINPEHTVFNGSGETYFGDDIYFGDGASEGETQFDDFRISIIGSGSNGVEVWNSNDGGTIVAEIDATDEFWSSFFSAFQKTSYFKDLKKGPEAIASGIKKLVKMFSADEDRRREKEKEEALKKTKDKPKRRGTWSTGFMYRPYDASTDNKSDGQDFKEDEKLILGNE